MRIACVNQDRGVAPDRNKGAAVHLVAMRDAFIAQGAEIFACDEPDDARLSTQLSEQHQRSPFGLVYERYALGKSESSRFAVRHGLPHVVEVNAPLADEQARYRDTPESPRDSRNDRDLFSQATGVVAVSRAVADYAIRRGAQTPSILVCPNGIDTARFNRSVDSSSVRATLPRHDDVVIGFHGRQRPWHGFDGLVRVFAKLKDQGLPIHLLVAGQGDFNELNELQRGSYTRVGWQPHERIAQYVAAFDILPLTYQPDAPCYFSPLKLAEAMACGVVPVVPDLGDLAEAVAHGDAGLVYAAGDDEALQACLEKLITDPAERRRLGQGAAEFVANQSWDNIAALVLERFADPVQQSKVNP